MPAAHQHRVGDHHDEESEGVSHDLLASQTLGGWFEGVEAEWQGASMLPSHIGRLIDSHLDQYDASQDVEILCSQVRALRGGSQGEHMLMPLVLTFAVRGMLRQYPGLC